MNAPGECAFCWHPRRDHDAQGCTVDLREHDETVVVCGCLAFESDQPDLDFDPGEADMQRMYEQRTRRKGEDHAAEGHEEAVYPGP